jgi:hypothetical protein
MAEDVPECSDLRGLILEKSHARFAQDAKPQSNLQRAP